MSKYVIDYGHCLSGADTGASGNGYREENLTREVGKLVVQKLRSLGHQVYEINLQNATSVNNSLNERIRLINNYNPDLAISIHFNAFNGSAYGTEVLTDGYNSSIANAILAEFETLGLYSRGIKNGSKLAVVGGVKPYAMLVECCFIDSSSDMKKYNPEAFANAIVKGVCGKLPQQANNSQNNVSKEEKKVKGIVIYSNDVDRRAAEYLADYLKVPTISSATSFDYTTVEQEGIYAVGGKQSTYTGYLLDKNFIAGSDRYETVKEVLKFIGKL